MKRKIVVAVGGSSGSIYAKLLLDKLRDYDLEVGVVFSTNGIVNWELENETFDPKAYPFTFYENNDFYAPFASGSALYDTMIVCPSSMGLVGRIAAGISSDLITRAADVILKERRRLIMVVRETPFSLIHLGNLHKITQAGGVICPAIPSFYSQPKTIEELCMTVIDRVIDLAKLPIFPTGGVTTHNDQ